MNFHDFTIVNSQSAQIHWGFGIYQEINLHTPLNQDQQRGFCSTDLTACYIYDPTINAYRDHHNGIVAFTPPTKRVYAAICTYVADGDTCDALITITPNLKLAARLRLKGIDAPELSKSKPEQYGAAWVARRVLETKILNQNINIHLSLIKKGSKQYQEGVDKYGRILADIFTGTSIISINDWMILNNFAIPYNI